MFDEIKFDRMDRLPKYVFAEVNELKMKERRAGADVIDFSMGNPDGDTPAHIREKLIEFHSKGLKPKIVLFDCGYMACKSVNLINSLGWKYLTICKSNNIFEKQGLKTNFTIFNPTVQLGPVFNMAPVSPSMVYLN